MRAVNVPVPWVRNESRSLYGQFGLRLNGPSTKPPPGNEPIYRIEGERLLRRIPEAMYQRVVAGVILLLGIWMALKINP